MSLTFGALTSDRATKTTPSGIGSTETWSAGGWVNVSTLTSNRVIQRFGGSTAGTALLRLSGTTGNVQISETGTGGNLSYITSDTPFSSTGTWVFLAVSINFTVATHIYTGTLSALCAERTYGTATNGITAPVTDTGTVTQCLGNNDASATVALPGKIGGFWQWYNRTLTLGEWRSIQFTGEMLSGCKGCWHPGDNGTGNVIDVSGNGNHLTVTGASQSNNPPLRSQSRPVVRGPYAVTAAGVLFRPYFLNR